MPALYPEAFQQMKQKLDALAPIAASLPGKAPEFISDMVQRVETYGERVFVSPGQLNWINSLFEKHASLPGKGAVAQPYGSSEDERREILGDDPKDTDDEIPF